MLVSLLNDGYWITGSILGNVFGGILPIRSEGIDFALTALFLTVFVEQWLRTKNHTPALIGVFSSIACLFIFGKDMYLLPTMFLISILLMMKRGVLDA